MKINPVQNTYINFESRNKYIRRADDIQRNVRVSFPMMSPTYMDIFYNCHKINNPDDLRRLRAEKLVDKVDKRISILRRIFSQENTNAFSDNELDVLKKVKIGNCGERVATVVAGFAANEIYDLETASLHFELKYTDKKTGKCEYSVTEPADHLLVIANLNPDSKDDKDKIIIDAWMGFADSKSGAMDRYKSIYNEKHLKEKLKFHRSMFRVNYAEKYGKLVNYSDFDVSTKLFLKTEQKFDKNQLNQLSVYCKLMHPELVLD